MINNIKCMCCGKRIYTCEANLKPYERKTKTFEGVFIGVFAAICTNCVNKLEGNPKYDGDTIATRLINSSKYFTTDNVPDTEVLKKSVKTVSKDMKFYIKHCC